MSGYAWVTLATNDSYSLGALVLAHSLKKCKTIHKLAILITPAVSQPMREQLQSTFDVVKLVDVLDSKDEAHLALLERPELGITFTKIHCWNLIEFKKCVFLDADTLVVRNCDELFEREEFSAAPDVSWPDCFNSGVFVFEPSVITFNKILLYAIQKGSFDGGDQGLLNQYFGSWATEDIKKHLPFVYNVTTTAAYSYIPAFKHYGSETRIVHFIGTGKPWLQKLDPATKKVTPTSGSEHLTPLLQKWWDLFSENVHPKLDKSLALDDPKGNMEVLKQKAGEQIVSLENEKGKLQSKLEKENTNSGMNQGILSTKSETEKQKEVSEKIPGEPAKEILPSVEKSTTDATLLKNQTEEKKAAQTVASDKQISVTQAPVVQPTIASPKESATNVCPNVSGNDVKLPSCESPTLSKTPNLPTDTKSAPNVPLPEAQIAQPLTPLSEKTSKPPLITETPATPITEKKPDEPKLPSAAQQQKESQKEAPANSQPVNQEPKKTLPDSQTNEQSVQSKQDVKPSSPNLQESNVSTVPIAPNLNTKSPSSSQITPATPKPELKTTEPLVSTPSTVPLTTPSSNIPQAETKSKEQIISTSANTTLPATSPISPLPTAMSVNKPAVPTQQIMTSTANLDAKAQSIIPPLAAVEDSSKNIPSSEPKLEPQPQPPAAVATESSTTNKSSGETIKEECKVKLSDILQSKESAETEVKDKPQAPPQQQDKNKAVVPYCDVLKQAQGTEEKEKEKEKPRSQKSIEELKKRQSEIKSSQLPPIPLPESPVKTQPDYSQGEEKNQSSQPASQQVTSEESKDPCLKTLSEGSLKDNEVPEKPAADTSKKQGEISSTKANEEGVPTSKSPRDEAKPTNTDKSKDVNFDKKKTSDMLQSETPSDGANKQDKQKAKEAQPKQEDSQSGNKKNKAKSKPPRNTAPGPPTKIEETKQHDNKDKKKDSPSADSLKTTQKQESLSKAAEVLATSLTEPKEAKDSSSKSQKSSELVTAELKNKDLETKLSNEGNIKSDLFEILNKAKTEVESRMQEKQQEGGEGLAPEVSELVNTMKLIVGENDKVESQTAGKKDAKNAQQNKQKPQKDGKSNKRGPQGQAPPPSTKMEEIEEVKVTSEEDRKKHKGQVTSSKLSDQILKAIPPPRRKAISDSKAETQDSNATTSDKTSSEATVPAAQKSPLDSASENAKPQSDVAKPQPDATKPQPDVAKPQPDVAKSQPNAAKPPNAAAGGKTANENTKPGNANQSEGKKGEGKMKSASGPVPPPRNRSKPRQPTPPKSKSKK